MFFIVLHSVLVHLLSLSLAFLKKKKWKEVYEKNKKTKTKKKQKETHNRNNESTNKRTGEWVLEFEINVMNKEGWMIVKIIINPICVYESNQQSQIPPVAEDTITSPGIPFKTNRLAINTSTRYFSSRQELHWIRKLQLT